MARDVLWPSCVAPEPCEDRQPGLVAHMELDTTMGGLGTVPYSLIPGAWWAALAGWSGQDTPHRGAEL